MSSLVPAPLDPAEALDRMALQQLAFAYCHAIDRQDYALLRSLYHDDAIDDHSPMFIGGPDEYVTWLPAMLANWQLTVHTLHNMLFLVDGDRAEGELYSTAWHRTADGSREVVAHGRYLDEYRKRDGVWKFYRRALVLDWFEDRPVQRGEGPGIDQGLATAKSGRTDPVYERLPMFAATRAER